jgi:hypothetical protein
VSISTAVVDIPALGVGRMGWALLGVATVLYFKVGFALAQSMQQVIEDEKSQLDLHICCVHVKKWPLAKSGLA